MFHNKVLITLEPKLEKWSQDQRNKKTEIDEKATNLLVLGLADSVLQKVNDCFTQVAPNLAYVKSAMFAYKMDASKSIDDNLDDVLK